MRSKRAVSLLLVASMLYCGQKDTVHPRGMSPDVPPTPVSILQPIDWEQSAGIFIGIAQFHAGSGLAVAYADDDATDLAHLFTRELRLLSPDRTSLLIAGHPTKPDSRRRLAELARHEGLVVRDDAGGVCLNGATIKARIEERARLVGPDGVLVLFISTHGLTARGQHLLLAADASETALKGVVVTEIMNALQAVKRGRLLLLIDACRQALLPNGPVNRFPLQPDAFLEELPIRVPYALFVAAGPGSLGYSSDELCNGYFTRAVIDALRGGAVVTDEGIVSINSLGDYIAVDVYERSGEKQRPEVRDGGIGDLPLFICGKPSDAGSIVSARRDETGESVSILAGFRNLYASVLVCDQENVCYNQHPPFPVRQNEIDTLDVHFARRVPYRVFVALTKDGSFLKDEREFFEGVPRDRRAKAIVYWLGPVDVPQPNEGRTR